MNTEAITESLDEAYGFALKSYPPNYYDIHHFASLIASWKNTKNKTFRLQDAKRLKVFLTKEMGSYRDFPLLPIYPPNPVDIPQSEFDRLARQLDKQADEIFGKTYDLLTAYITSETK